MDVTLRRTGAPGYEPRPWLLRLGRLAIQRRGAIFDLWTNFGRREATVVCLHGHRWPEGGRIPCRRCVERRTAAYEARRRLG